MHGHVLKTKNKTGRNWDFSIVISYIPMTNVGEVNQDFDATM